MDKGDLISSDPNVVRTLLEEGADVHAFVGGDAPEVRPLGVHCYMGRAWAVQLLLQYGADPNLGRESTAETPLHHATAQPDRADCIQLLLEAGADVNRPTNVGIISINLPDGRPVRGETPLHRAAAYGTEQIIGLLLAAGADKTLTDSNEERPYDWAVSANRDESILNILR